MRKLLRDSVRWTFSLIAVGVENLKENLALLFNKRQKRERGAGFELPGMGASLESKEKKLEEQESRTDRQLNELEETRARIKFLRAQLHTLGNGSRKR